MMTTDTSPSVLPCFFFSADDNMSIWRESWRISSSKSARVDVIARERDKKLSKNLSACSGGTESPANDFEYVTIVPEMSLMASKSLESTSFRALSLRTTSAVLAVSISSTPGPIEHTTSNSWASPRPVTRADSVSIEPGRWRIWILLWPS
jgi:hypothetical protein